jgi:hypothetical protein
LTGVLMFMVVSLDLGAQTVTLSSDSNCPQSVSSRDMLLAPLAGQSHCLVQSVQQDFALAPEKYLSESLRVRRSETWGHLSKSEQEGAISWIIKNLGAPKAKNIAEKVYQLQKAFPYQDYTLDEAAIRLAILVFRTNS